MARKTLVLQPIAISAVLRRLRNSWRRVNTAIANQVPWHNTPMANVTTPGIGPMVARSMNSPTLVNGVGSRFSLPI